MSQQERYWRELDQLKVHNIYLALYFEKTYYWDLWTKIILAVASSSSIAGWAIWQQFSFVWGLIIATSQVLNAVKPFLPYSKRLKALQSASGELEALFIVMEDRWFEVSQGNMNNQEIHKVTMGFKEKKRQIMQKHMSGLTLPHNKKMMDEAVAKAVEYFEIFG
ncbi:hypothetical protein [Pseudovibrio sp. Tun.PSC04-5.I4]|uniref:hypothetical protein n=1 Tax=Pseudovibrio sp. Tun.PSC04-5.I4 TaxID=1798213 RepID=UPI00088DA355|nr:hypothetical protein [Pseudovibrio sp. Tun.PSC04-5.I4]SDQ81236.1 hypothetical protein SAMN04515695_1495 [Pseudovibrio sp. Tun.PSC04-5.I4]